jgi:hypothetical protein
MNDSQNEERALTIEERINRKLREAELHGREVEFDPDEAERIAFREDAHRLMCSPSPQTKDGAGAG